MTVPVERSPVTRVQLAPCWSRPDANELRARRIRLSVEGPFRKRTAWQRFVRWCGWMVGSQ